MRTGFWFVLIVEIFIFNRILGIVIKLSQDIYGILRVFNEKNITNNLYIDNIIFQ